MVSGSNFTIADLSTVARYLPSALKGLRQSQQEAMFHIRTAPELFPYDPNRVSIREVGVMDSYLVDHYNFAVFAGRRNGLLNDNSLKQLEEIRPGQISEDALDSLLRSYLMLAQGKILKLVHTKRVGACINEIMEEDIKILSRIAYQISETEYLSDKGSPNEKVLGIVSDARNSIQSVRQRNNFNRLEYNLDLISKSLNTAIKLLKLKTIQLNENSKLSPTAVVYDTGMSSYIDPNEKPYGDSEDFHAGRPQARQGVVIPILLQHLSTTEGEKRIAEMGSADGKTSTIDFVEKLPGVYIDAIEFDRNYFQRLETTVRNCKQVSPLHMSITDYKPAKPNSLDAFVALGAFSDFSPDQKQWVDLLSRFKKDYLKPGGIVVLEEEVHPYSVPGDVIARKKALAIQRGHIIFDAFLRDKVDPRIYASVQKELYDREINLSDPYIKKNIVPIAELELDALLSSLSFDKQRRFGDYKGTLVDFGQVFKDAGYSEFYWVKIYPGSTDVVAELSSELLTVDPEGGFMKSGKSNTALDYYNFIFNQLLLVDTSVPDPSKDIHYDMALDTMHRLYKEIKKYKDNSNGRELLESRLGLRLVPGQSLSISGRLEDDKIGGVYVLVAKT